MPEENNSTTPEARSAETAWVLAWSLWKNAKAWADVAWNQTEKGNSSSGKAWKVWKQARDAELLAEAAEKKARAKMGRTPKTPARMQEQAGAAEKKAPEVFETTETPALSNVTGTVKPEGLEPQSLEKNPPTDEQRQKETHAKMAWAKAWVTAKTAKTALAKAERVAEKAALLLAPGDPAVKAVWAVPAAMAARLKVAQVKLQAAAKDLAVFQATREKESKIRAAREKESRERVNAAEMAATAKAHCIVTEALGKAEARAKAALVAFHEARAKAAKAAFENKSSDGTPAAKALEEVKSAAAELDAALQEARVATRKPVWELATELREQEKLTDIAWKKEEAKWGAVFGVPFQGSTEYKKAKSRNSRKNRSSN